MLSSFIKLSRALLPFLMYVHFDGFRNAGDSENEGVGSSEENILMMFLQNLSKSFFKFQQPTLWISNKI